MCSSQMTLGGLVSYVTALAIQAAIGTGEFHARSVCRSVRPLATTVNSGKIADSIELPLGVVSRVSPRYHVLNGGSAPMREGAKIFWKWDGTMSHVRSHFKQFSFCCG